MFIYDQILYVISEVFFKNIFIIKMWKLYMLYFLQQQELTCEYSVCVALNKWKYVYIYGHDILWNNFSLKIKF